LRELTLADGEGERAAKQADAHQSYFLEQHRRIKSAARLRGNEQEWRWRLFGFDDEINRDPRREDQFAEERPAFLQHRSIAARRGFEGSAETSTGAPR
jgi:hypothetical protein